MAKGAQLVAWRGEDGSRMEVARVARRDGGALIAEGMQVGSIYALHYSLRADALTLTLLGEPPSVIELGDADFFDLGWSPLFNSLPVLRDGLLAGGPERRYRMKWVDVPSLEVHWSEQYYAPHGAGVVGFRVEGFSAEITFDDDGFVRSYPGIGYRVDPPDDD